MIFLNKMEVGSRVRIRRKGKWSKTIYEIISVSPTRLAFKLKNLNTNKELKIFYYHGELLKISEPSHWTNEWEQPYWKQPLSIRPSFQQIEHYVAKRKNQIQEAKQEAKVRLERELKRLDATIPEKIENKILRSGRILGRSTG